MFLNISDPVTGSAIKKLEIEDERQIAQFYDKRISSEVAVDFLGDEWTGYVLKITGGNDKQGFPMYQGVLSPARHKLLLKKGCKGYIERKDGEKKRKTVRGCIVSPAIRALNLIVVQRGEQEIDGLTNVTVPLRRQPKRASKIRKLHGLDLDADVKKYVMTRKVTTASGKTVIKAPKVQRLATAKTLKHRKEEAARKVARIAKSQAEKQAYEALLAQRSQ